MRVRRCEHLIRISSAHTRVKNGDGASSVKELPTALAHGLPIDLQFRVVRAYSLDSALGDFWMKCV